MPLFNPAPKYNQYGSSANLATEIIEITVEEQESRLSLVLPTQGEIQQSFEYADTPGGWHLVWLDEAIDLDGTPCAHLMVAPRWVAKPITTSERVPIWVRWVPSLEIVQKGLPDLEALPLAGKAYGQLIVE